MIINYVCGLFHLGKEEFERDSLKVDNERIEGYYYSEINGKITSGTLF